MGVGKRGDDGVEPFANAEVNVDAVDSFAEIRVEGIWISLVLSYCRSGSRPLR